MTWEQKFHAICALGETSLRMRNPGSWYVNCRGRSTKNGPHDVMLRGSYGNGLTPEEAVEDDWNQITASGVIVVTEDGRRVVWNGFMWIT